MAQIDLTWIAEQRFLGVDSGGHSVVLSAANDIGVKPAETLLIALAACSAYDIVAIIAKRRARLEQLSVQVRGEQAERPPYQYTRIHLRYTATAQGLPAAQFHRTIDLALNKYCTVRASLSPAIEITFEALLNQSALPLPPPLPPLSDELDDELSELDDELPESDEELDHELSEELDHELPESDDELDHELPESA
ncbi:MAG: OsmC family protein [Roseiflexaceae bacterium]|nr:OsmC family protein [Roseiflexaceae bacterium]